MVAGRKGLRTITTMLYPADPNGVFKPMMGNTERNLIDALIQGLNSTKRGTAE